MLPQMHVITPSQYWRVTTRFSKKTIDPEYPEYDEYEYDYGLMESHGRSHDAPSGCAFYPLHRSPWKFVPGTMSSTSCCSPSAPQQATGHGMSEDSEAVSGQLHFRVRRDTERFCVYRTYSNNFQHILILLRSCNRISLDIS